MLIPPPLSVATGNWAGYEWHGGVTAAAEFAVPEFPYHDLSTAEKRNHTVLSIWAGLTNGPDIAQIGVYDYVQAGHVNWAGVCAFWPKTDVGCGHGISTGDKIFLKVQRNGLSYTMTMHDAGPHNVWSVSIKGSTGSVDTTAAVMAEDSTYPGNPMTPLTYFSPFKVGTSGNPATMFYSSNVGHAQKLSNREFQIDPR